MALRHLLSSLGFELPKRKLKGEVTVTQNSGIEKLVELQMDPSSAEAEALKANFKKTFDIAESVANML